MSQNPSDFEQPVTEKPKRDQRYQDSPRGGGVPARLIGGIVLIGLSVIFLLKQYGVDIPLFQNWWAFFILLPAIGAFWTGYTAYQRAGVWTNEARGAIAGGVLIALVAFVFLFQLDWGKIWPLFLIVPGVPLLFGMWGPNQRRY